MLIYAFTYLLILFRTHGGEEEHFLDGRLTGHEDGQTVNANANAGRRRHAVLQRTHEVVVDDHGLVVALVGQLHLLNEAVVLVDGVVELRVY